MMQKTLVELVMTPQEAEKYHRTIHRALYLLLELPPLTDGAFEQAELRADLMRLAAMLDDPVVPCFPPPVKEKPRDPFTPEGDGSARDVLLGRIVSVCSLMLGSLANWAERSEHTAILHRAKLALLADWREYEELGRG